MLNEILEYEEYISKDEKVIRLGSRGLNNKLGGYVRALIIIARHFLFGENMENPASNIESTIECLKAWLGFEYDEAKLNNSAKSEIESIKNWFPDCINKISKSSEHENVLLNILETKKATLQFYLYTNPSKKTNDKNSAKSVTYESIIADALDQGPLNKYLLKVKDAMFEGLTKESNSNDVDINQTDEDLIKKLTAYYLISQKEQIARQCWIIINSVNLMNWSTRNNDLNHNKWLEKFTYNSTALFEKTNIGNNTIKIKINKEWIDDNKIEIVSYGDYNPNDGFTYYEDMGANKPLAIYSGSRCGDE